MDGGNHDIMNHNQDLGGGEVINMEQSGVKYHFSFVRHGEDICWWEYQIPENNNYLEIPEEFSFFFNRNPREIKVIDQENGERYACDVHFGKGNMDGIYVENGWSDYLKARDLKK
ncbi:hypothetical protein QL285_026008 [Trifolium repens]|nr:hypothetical protein QL285_026008 [Trifolium repens]